MMKKINVIGGGLLLALTAPATAQDASRAAAQARKAASGHPRRARARTTGHTKSAARLVAGLSQN